MSVCGDAAPGRIYTLSLHDALPISAQYKRWLGRETGVLVWDGWQGNPPDGFAGLAGTLRAGGLLFWLMPPLAEWPGFEDPDYSRTGLDGAGEHRFLARLAEIGRAHV